VRERAAEAHIAMTPPAPAQPAPALTAPQPTPEPAPPAAKPPREMRRLEPAPEADHPGWEEIERRHTQAARIRRLIEAGPDATGPATGGGLLAEGDPHPVYENGELRGVELNNLKPDGLYVRLGLREGDLVQSVNGIGLEDGAAVVEEVATAPALDVAVERTDGTQDHIAVLREQILEALAALSIELPAGVQLPNGGER
jgi:hypothetical protein